VEDEWRVSGGVVALEWSTPSIDFPVNFSENMHQCHIADHSLARRRFLVSSAWGRAHKLPQTKFWFPNNRVNILGRLWCRPVQRIALWFPDLRLELRLQCALKF